MSVTVNFGSFTKKRNSTKQPTNELSDSRSVVFKESTSVDSPTFILTGNAFDYNYASWDDGTITRYYFISDIRTMKNNLTEIDCVLDVLATYRAEILDSTQYVCYSSQSGGSWLPDTRIPVLKETTTALKTTSLSTLFNTTGFYVLSATGKEGCCMYALDKSQLDSLIASINTWATNVMGDIVSDSLSYGYDFSTVEKSIQSLGKMSIQTGVIGNAYANAPQCIRSCIWVPFFASQFVSTGAELYLGNFDTGIHPFTVKAAPATGSTTVDIPWIHSDWLRMYDNVYLYLPLAGMIQLSADSLTDVSQLTINYSATASDGVVAYTVEAGGNIIGTFGGQCSANYPIGINQQASAGEIIQSMMAGAESMVNAAINSSISPVSMAAAGAGVALEGVNAAYNTANVANSTHPSTIGGVGGGAGSGLSLDIQCYVVSHDTVIAPEDMTETMGVPTMQPIQLSSLEDDGGFCQCANAHVEAAAMAGELDAIDYYLNSGFYIE